MGERIATIVIEPRLLVREALVSLIAGHSYHVVGGIASMADIGKSLPAAGAAKLVILGALSAPEATTAASCIRKRWPRAKIILLFEHTASADLQKLLASEIDGCIPLSVSPETLIGALRQIVATDLRMLILSTAATSQKPRTTGEQEERDELDLDPNGLIHSNEAENALTDGAASVRTPHGLSKREEQILIGLVKGHSNKMIARTCASTESTIKVHVKSILRKIRMANRTQAAIWALEQGYGTDGVKGQAKSGRPVHIAPKHQQVEASPPTVA
jgi:two-component system nitrate/nitrite response regulator NarL